MEDLEFRSFISVSSSKKSAFFTRELFHSIGDNQKYKHSSLHLYLILLWVWCYSTPVGNCLQQSHDRNNVYGRCISGVVLQIDIFGKNEFQKKHWSTLGWLSYRCRAVISKYLFLYCGAEKFYIFWGLEGE